MTIKKKQQGRPPVHAPQRPKGKKVQQPPPPSEQRNKLGQFVKGICPNPSGGRSKSGSSLAEQLREALDGGPRRKIIGQLVKMAKEGDLDAIKLLVAWGAGSPPKEPVVTPAPAEAAEANQPDLNKLSVDDRRAYLFLIRKALGLPVVEPKPAAPPPQRADFVSEVLESRLIAAPANPKPQPVPVTVPVVEVLPPEPSVEERVKARVLTMLDRHRVDNADDLYRPNPLWSTPR